MRFVWLLIMFYAAKAAGSQTLTQEYLADIENDNAAMWEKLFTQLNTMSSEIAKLSQGQAHLNQRFDELSKRLEDCQTWPLKPIEHEQAVRGDVNKRNVLIETVQEFREDFNKRQDIQDNLLKQSFSYNQKWDTILYNGHDIYYNNDFNNNWNEYQNGFTTNSQNRFVGLNKVHELTTYQSAQELVIILTDWNGETRYAKYDLFQVGSAAEKYVLKKLGAYSGDAGDSLLPHLGHKFSTYDQDNDDNDETNCASTYGGGWWFFGDCNTSLLTGPLRTSDDSTKTWGISWSTWHGWNYSLKSVEMKIRPTLKTHFDTNVEASGNTESFAML